MKFSFKQECNSFRFFPYPPNQEEGRTNNGGIDLVSEPHRIDEITEIGTFAAFRSFLTVLNGEGGLFMTLGCEAGGYEEAHHQLYGYLEICTRSPVDLSYYENLLQQFSAWTDDRLKGVRVEDYLNFEWSRFSYPGKHYVGTKLVCWFTGCGKDLDQATEDAANALGSFVEFLSAVDQSAPEARRPSGSSR